MHVLTLKSSRISSRVCQQSSLHTDTFVLTWDMRSCSAFGSNDILIYPNPAQNEIIIDASDASNDYEQIKITDVTGKVIFETALNSNKMTVIDLRDFAGGIYHIHMASSTGTTVKQFIKK